MPCRFLAKACLSSGVRCCTEVVHIYIYIHIYIYMYVSNYIYIKAFGFAIAPCKRNCTDLGPGVEDFRCRVIAAGLGYGSRFSKGVEFGVLKKGLGFGFCRMPSGTARAHSCNIKHPDFGLSCGCKLRYGVSQQEYSILGSILGCLYFGKLPYAANKHLFHDQYSPPPGIQSPQPLNIPKIA